MRLLTTDSLQFREFIDSRIPKYAILSHRWEEAEVSFHEFQNSIRERSASLLKVLQCCSMALRDGFKFIWIDTCCIDKTSSAELSEAINSMYQWYSRAEVCYTYLSDVNWNQDTEADILSSRVAFRNSVWFERGW